MRAETPSVLAIIPARGGSKGLPGKNIRPLAGKPLIQWTVEAARAARCINRVIVSTDDDDIAAVAQASGAEVPFVRPAELATDTATSADVMAHALTMVPGYDAAVLLQPTSPFRTSLDLDCAFAMWQTSGASSCVSVCQATESPWLMFSRSASGRIESLLPTPPGGLRRQDLPPAYSLNGAFYFIWCSQFLTDRKLLHSDTIGYVMPIERSLDIDVSTDLDSAHRSLESWGGTVPKRLL